MVLNVPVFKHPLFSFVPNGQLINEKLMVLEVQYLLFPM